MFFKSVFDKNSSPEYATDMQKTIEKSKYDILVVKNLSSKITRYDSPELYQILVSSKNKYSYITPYNLDKKLKLMETIDKYNLNQCKSHYLEDETRTTIELVGNLHGEQKDRRKIEKYKDIIEKREKIDEVPEYNDDNELLHCYLPYKAKRRCHSGRKKVSSEDKKIISYEKYLDKEKSELECIDALAVVDLDKGKEYNRRLESVRIDADNDCTINLCMIKNNIETVPCIYPKKFSRVNKAAMIGII